MAVRVFSDPFALSEQDRIEGGEYRWQTVGSVDGIIILFVVYAVHEDEGMEIISIISARSG